MIRLDQILFHPDSLRRELGDLRDLVESIASYGVLQPVEVERRGSGFVLRLGNRRVAAARLAGLRTVPALIHADVLDEKALLLRSVQENVTRRAIPAADKRRAVVRLRDTGCSWRQVAAAFHVSPKRVSGWVIGDDDDTGPRATNPRRRAVLRLIDVHPDEFDRLFAEERERDAMDRARRGAAA